MEYPQGGFEKCNKRKGKKMLQTIYPNVDFSKITPVTNGKRNQESIFKLNQRIKKLWEYIGKLKAKRIAVVSHSSFIGQLKDKKIGDEKNELKHCYPYVMEAQYDDEKNFICAYEINLDHTFEEEIEE